MPREEEEEEEYMLQFLEQFARLTFWERLINDKK
jgi:hypothetical protein